MFNVDYKVNMVINGHRNRKAWRQKGVRRWRKREEGDTWQKAIGKELSVVTVHCSSSLKGMLSRD